MHGGTSPSLAFAITPGRSGTTLLAKLLQMSAGIHAEHEPVPRLNFVMRAAIEAPSTVRGWLESEKLPAIRQTAQGSTYVETSHIVGKGFVEPLLELPLDLKFFILTRPAEEVAASFLAIDCIPGRSESGRLVCVSPSDPGVLPVASPADLSDYQLCYWYALEMERRQVHYAGLFRTRGIAHQWVAMTELTDWERFRDLVAFLDPRVEPDRDAFDAIVARNQNPVMRVAGGAPRPVPLDAATQRLDLEDRVRRAGGTMATAAA